MASRRFLLGGFRGIEEAPKTNSCWPLGVAPSAPHSVSIIPLVAPSVELITIC